MNQINFISYINKIYNKINLKKLKIHLKIGFLTNKIGINELISKKPSKRAFGSNIASIRVTSVNQ